MRERAGKHYPNPPHPLAIRHVLLVWERIDEVPCLRLLAHGHEFLGLGAGRVLHAVHDVLVDGPGGQGTVKMSACRVYTSNPKTQGRMAVSARVVGVTIGSIYR